MKRFLLVALATLLAVIGSSGCEPRHQTTFAVGYDGTHLLTQSQAPLRGEVIFSFSNRSAKPAHPMLLRVDQPSDALTRGPVPGRRYSVLAGPFVVGGATGPLSVNVLTGLKVHVHSVRLHVFLRPGYYVLVADGIASLKSQSWFAFVVA